MIERFLLVHNEFGVYLGSCMGLGFWSQLDAAGQEEACTFSSVKEALDHYNSWDGKEMFEGEEDGKFIPVHARINLPKDQVNEDGSAYATMIQVVNAGFKSWKP